MYIIAIADNADSAQNLFHALDEAGIVDKMYTTVYAIAAGVAPIGISPIRQFQSMKRVGECLEPSRYGMWYHFQNSAFYKEIQLEEYEKLTGTLEDLQLFSDTDKRAAGMCLARGL